MKTLVSCLCHLLLSFSSAFAWSGPISTPQLPWTPDLNDKQGKKVLELSKLLQNEVTFIEGYFSGPIYTSQRFGGDSRQTASVIEELLQANIWTVTLKFHQFEEQKTAFTIVSDHDNRLIITVNSDRDDFLLKDFARCVGIAHEETNAEQAGARQPATAVDSKSESNEKPESESEGRSK